MYPSVALVSCSGYQSALTSLLCNIADELRRWQVLYQNLNYYAPPKNFLPNPKNSPEILLINKTEKKLKIRMEPPSAYLLVMREIEKNVLLMEDFKTDDSSLLAKVKSNMADHFLMGTFKSKDDSGAKPWGTELRQNKSTKSTWEDKNNVTYKDAVVYGHMTDSQGRLNIKNEIISVDQRAIATEEMRKHEELGRERGRDIDEIKLKEENIEFDINIKIQNLLLDFQLEYGRQVRSALTKKIKKSRQTDPLNIHLNLHHYLPPHRYLCRFVHYFILEFVLVVLTSMTPL